MPDQPPASLPPEKVPGTGGSGPFVAIAAILALVLGGLLVFKFKGNSQPETPTVTSAPPPSATVARPALTDSLPPPPKEDTPPPTDSATTAKPKPGTTGNGPCGGPCAGTPSAGTRGDLASRAGSARGCYERALRTNSTLQGKMTVSVRVDPQGNVCSAAVGADTVGSGEVSSCVVNMFKNQRVAAPQGGCADVSIPLNFQPKK